MELLIEHILALLVTIDLTKHYWKTLISFLKYRIKITFLNIPGSLHTAILQQGGSRVAGWGQWGLREKPEGGQGKGENSTLIQSYSHTVYLE